MKILEFSESKLPVGSSAKIMSGELISDLAIETLCCSPPDSSFGLCVILSERSSSFNISFPFFSELRY